MKEVADSAEIAAETLPDMPEYRTGVCNCPPSALDGTIILMARQGRAVAAGMGIQVQ